MAKTTATFDVFTAIAEPRRREVLGALAESARDVTWLVDELGWPQPQVSKHLGVLRKVGLVSVTRKGRRRVYNVNGREMRPVYEWVKRYEHFWEHQLQRIKDRAERAVREAQASQDKPKQ
jgi:DNA-binding transcriptional ArsR family regulator